MGEIPLYSVSCSRHVVPLGSSNSHHGHSLEFILQDGPDLPHELTIPVCENCSTTGYRITSLLRNEGALKVWFS